MRVMGFRASTDRLRQVLSISSSLTSHFANLEHHFPSAKIILKDFHTCNEIQKIINSLPRSYKQDPKRKSKSKIYSPFCEAIASKEFKHIDFEKYPRIGELFAFFWLLHASTHAAPGLVIPTKLGNLLNVSIHLARSMWMVVEDNPSFSTSWVTSLKENLSNWFAEAGKAIEQATMSNLAISISSQEIQEGFEQARQLIGQLTAARNSDRQGDDGIDESQPRFSEQRGVGLYERERLSTHHNAFQDSEIKALTKSLRGIIEHEYDSMQPKLPHLDVLPPYYIESAIVTLAIATGRGIEEVIKFPLSSELGEYFENELVGGVPKFTYPIWHRKISDECHLKIPLPSFLKEPISQLFSFDLAETVEDCLPYSITDWSIRCLDWLKEEQLSGSAHEVDRRVRDALAREIYKSTASPALLRIITTPISDILYHTESLSRYVNPLDERTLSAYKSACTNLFNKYGADNSLCKLFSSDDFAVSQEQHCKVAEFFQRQIEIAEQADDFIAHHNWISRYILMLLIVATGHRKSLTPFYFPWDILFDENLAFVCDKLTVGSEARFVPIPAWLSSLILDYRNHLYTLTHRLSQAAPELAKRIHHLAKGGDLHVLYQGREITDNSLSKNKLGFGFFFKIDGKLNGKNLSTADLVKSYSSVYTGKIGEFRKSAANSLWTNGYSGHQIEAFLGHNGEMHCFGESSAWSISVWSNDIRAWQEEYLSIRGWKAIRLKHASPRESKFAIHEVPLMSTCGDAYEGRNRGKQQALATAIKIVRENLPSIWFLDEQSTITDKDVRQLKEIVESKLLSDPKACEQVNLALAQEIDRIRKDIGKVSTSIANLTRTEPCPVPIFASRHFKIASRIRTWWHEEIGKVPMRDSEEAAILRLAEIGISLIICDALLDRATWKFILEEISLHETTKAHGCLNVHTQIWRKSRIYDKSVTLSPTTSALILGFKYKHAAFKPTKSTKSTIEEVTKRINRLLLSAPVAHASEKLDVSKLIDVFKSWWIIRLPGAQYSVAIGEHSGPAADILSKCAMYDIPCGRTDPIKPLAISSTSKGKIRHDAVAAHDFINDFLAIADGSLELKNASTRYQRQRLSRSLMDFDLPKVPELVELLEDHQIVSLMFEFLLYMLEEGGERKEVLTFNAIRTYYSNIHKLLMVLWDKSVSDFASADFDSAYREVKKLAEGKKVNLGTPLSLFHKFMRETYDAPPSLVADTINRLPIQCRATVITHQQHEVALHQIGSFAKNDGQIIHHTKTYLYLIYNHAMRSKEAYGIRAKHFLSTDPITIKIARNASRDLKTGNSLRATQSMLASADQSKLFRGAMELCNQSPAHNSYLFDDQEMVNQLYPTWRIDKAATNVLRAKTGNPRVVPYSMRHSAATRLTHWAFTSPRTIPLSNHVEKTLKGSLNEQAFFSCFDQGFSAWPFWIDRVGMYVGQSGVNTLLNTYWHTSGLRLAEHTWFVAEKNPLSESQLANMLGRDKSAISHQKKRLQSSVNPEHLDDNIIESLILHYVEKSDFPTIGHHFIDEFSQKVPKTSNQDSNTDTDEIRWIGYDRLMRTRLDKSLTLDQVKTLATKFSLSKLKSQTFIAAYVDIVRETGFADFEPNNSEILAVISKRNLGISPGAKQRERGLSTANRLATSTDDFTPKLNEFARLWIGRVDSKKPWLVARNESEFHLMIEVLLKLGVSESQLEYSYCNFDQRRLSKLLTKQQLEDADSQQQRLSRGPQEIRMSEIGIRVEQSSQSKIGDNRDTHRLILMLAAISRAELVQ